MSDISNAVAAQFSANMPSVEATPSPDNQQPPAQEDAQVDVVQEAQLPVQQESVDQIITEEDIVKALENSIPDNPTFNKEDNQQGQATKNSDSIIDELATVADELSNQNKELTDNYADVIGKLETLQTELAESKDMTTKIDNLFNEIAKDIPFISEFAEAKVKWENYTIPLQYIPENYQRVEQHPIVWPLVESLLKGEEISPADFVKSLSSTRRSQLPSETQVSVPKNDKEEIKSSVQHGLLPGTSITIN